MDWSDSGSEDPVSTMCWNLPGSELPRQSSSRWDLCCSAWHLWPSSGNDPETGRSDIQTIFIRSYQRHKRRRLFQASGLWLRPFSKFDNYLIFKSFRTLCVGETSSLPPCSQAFVWLHLQHSVQLVVDGSPSAEDMAEALVGKKGFHSDVGTGLPQWSIWF